MAALLTKDDLTWIEAGGDDSIKESRRVALSNLIEMNGIKFDAGIGKSYIPIQNYYHCVRIPDITENVSELLEKALNFNALGGGIGGLAGAGVRWGLRQFYKMSREYTLVDKWHDSFEAIIAKFSAQSKNKKDLVSFWTAQCDNVLCLAGAIFNREMHHWNSENTKPQAALVNALNQTEEVPENEFRKLFYLSIHPIPLDTMESYRQSAAIGKLKGINDSVALRCRSAPAGYGDVHACSQAIPDLRAESFYNKFGEGLKAELNMLHEMNNELITNASEFHVFASSYGQTRKKLPVDKIKRAMICTCAYIIVNVRGSLAQSAALQKFKSQHSRSINVWILAFEKKTEDETPTLEVLAAD
jgi:hypothetical protein